MPFSASSPWNTAIPSGSTYASLNWPGTTGYNYTVNWNQYSPAVYTASASDPLVQVQYPAGWGYPGGTISVHMPVGATGAAGSDAEIVVVDGNIAYNFWEFNRTSDTTATAQSMGESNIVTDTGFGTTSPLQGAGTTAIGSSELGGLLTQADANAGVINHALQLVVDSSLVQAGYTGSAISGDGGSSTGIVQEGELLGIAPGTAMPSGLSPLGQEVFTALQNYGAYVVDVAGATAIRAQANAFDTTTMGPLWQDMNVLAPMLEAVTPGSGTGTNDPVATPPVTTNVTPPSTTPTITVTDPPATSASTATSGRLALLNQFIASGFDQNSVSAPLTSNFVGAFGHNDWFLTSPRHAA
jgi:hypothetical protein